MNIFTYFYVLFLGQIAISELFQNDFFLLDNKAIADKYLQLLQKFEVALCISKKEVIIPSLMPEHGEYPKTNDDLNGLSFLDDCYQPPIRRIWFSNYIPDGFWPRLICRIMTDQQIKSILSNYKDTENHTHLSWVCWRNGIVFKSRGYTLFIVHLVTDTHHKDFKYRIEVHIYIPEMNDIIQDFLLQESDYFDEMPNPIGDGTRLMVAVSNHISFLSSWFHGMLSNENGYIPCWKCYSNIPALTNDDNTVINPDAISIYVDNRKVYCLSFNSCIVPACTGNDLQCIAHNTLIVIQTAPDLVCLLLLLIQLLCYCY